MNQENLLDEPPSPAATAPDLGVVVVTYFTGPLLWRCLESVLAQPETAAVAVVDNGNWPVVTEELFRLAKREPRVVVVSGQGNVGFAAGCNLGAAAIDTRHLLILNPDAVLPSGAAGALLAEGQKASGEAPFLVGAKLVHPDGKEQAGARRGPLTPWTALVEMTKLYKIAPKHPYFTRFNNHTAPCPGKTVEMPVISGACMLMPKAAYDAIGGMDEGYFLHAEDIDFCLRFLRAGGRIFYVAPVEVVHHKSSSRTNRVTVERLKAKNISRYFKQHFTGAYPPGFLSAVSAMIWAGVGFRAAKGGVKRGAGVLRLSRRSGFKRARRALRLSRKAAGR